MLSCCRDTHREIENVWQFREDIQHTCYDCKGYVGAQDAKRGNAGKVPEELFLLDGNASIEDYGWQQIPAADSMHLSSVKAT